MCVAARTASRSPSLRRRRRRPPPPLTAAARRRRVWGIVAGVVAGATALALLETALKRVRQAAEEAGPQRSLPAPGPGPRPAPGGTVSAPLWREGAAAREALKAARKVTRK
jgi:hypothetical protein